MSILYFLEQGILGFIFIKKHELRKLQEGFQVVANVRATDRTLFWDTCITYTLVAQNLVTAWL
jgi:flagellar assembly factor FliW